MLNRAGKMALRRYNNHTRRLDNTPSPSSPDHPPPPPLPHRHDRALRALAAFKKPTRNQSLIDSRLLFHHCVMSSEVETSLDISEIVRDSSTPLGMTIYPISPRHCVP